MAGATIRVLLGMAAAGLVACSSSPSATSGVPAQPVSPPAQASNDPLIHLVATMPDHTDEGFREPATGQLLKVEVIRSYDAASGRPCREFTVTDEKGVQKQEVACRAGDGWVRARPLRLEGAPGNNTRQP